MGIFEKKKSKKEGVVMAKAPEEPETSAEEDYIENLSEETETKENPKAKKSVAEQPEISVREVPVCLSQAQVNNLIIENNIMLKQIISNMDN